jgi:HEPN domain-containing protein
MKRKTAQWVHKAEDDFKVARSLATQAKPPREIVGFHCQQSAEKYLKALLQELGQSVPRTHNLNDLLNLLLPHDPTLASLRRGLKGLTRYAVDYRYPGISARTREMKSALRIARRIRSEIRRRLGKTKP